MTAGEWDAKQNHRAYRTQIPTAAPWVFSVRQQHLGKCLV